MYIYYIIIIYNHHYNCHLKTCFFYFKMYYLKNKDIYINYIDIICIHNKDIFIQKILKIDITN